jgi:hypothetical protein
VHHLHAGAGFEQLGRQMRRRADAGRGVEDFPAPALGERDQVLDALDAGRGMHDQDHRRECRERDRREILRHVEAGSRADGLVGDVGGRAEEQRVAIFGGACGKFRRKARAGARLVLDHELLAKQLAEPIAERSRRDVGRRAGNEADHDTHRLVEIVIRAGGHRGADCRPDEEDGGCNGADGSLRGSPSLAEIRRNHRLNRHAGSTGQLRAIRPLANAWRQARPPHVVASRHGVARNRCGASAPCALIGGQTCDLIFRLTLEWEVWMTRQILLALACLGALLFRTSVSFGDEQCLRIKSLDGVSITKDVFDRLKALDMSNRAKILASLQQVADFETSGCWADPTGDFDKQILSVGVLQWNYGQNSLQRIITAFEKKFSSPSAFIAWRRKMMPNHGSLIFSAGCKRVKGISDDCRNALLALQNQGPRGQVLLTDSLNRGSSRNRVGEVGG